MAQVTLTPSDFGPWGVEDDPKLAELIEDVLAQAATLAPCIVDPAFPYDKAARATLREAVLRRLDAGTGGVVTKTQGTGPLTRAAIRTAEGKRLVHGHSLIQPVAWPLGDTPR